MGLGTQQQEWICDRQIAVFICFSPNSGDSFPFEKASHRNQLSSRIPNDVSLLKRRLMRTRGKHEEAEDLYEEACFG